MKKKSPGSIFQTSSCTRLRQVSNEKEATPENLNGFQVEQKLSQGGYGQVYQVKFCVSPYNTAAMKIGQRIQDNVIIKHEASILQKLQGIVGIPTLYKVGISTNNKQTKIFINSSYICMQQLQTDLAEAYIREKFGLRKIARIGIEVTRILKQIHSRGFLHRDLKPANFMQAQCSSGIEQYYLVDFGLAVDMNDYENRKPPQNFVGTLNFAALSQHQKTLACFKDDIEMLLYSLIYFIDGRLPWQRIKGATKVDTLNLIGQAKHHLMENLQQYDIPIPLKFLLRYVYTLKESEPLDYGFIEQKIGELAPGCVSYLAIPEKNFSQVNSTLENSPRDDLTPSNDKILWRENTQELTIHSHYGQTVHNKMVSLNQMEKKFILALH